MACTRPTICIAVGGYPGRDGLGHTLAVTWNGTRWRVLKTPSPGTRLSDLASVSCASPVSCIAVGSYLNIGQPFTTTLAEQWNGTSWRALPPLRTGRGGSLLAISCTGATHCIALGAQVRPGHAGPLAEAWNGTTWRMLPTANLGTANGNLLSISCPRADRCTAAGDYFGTADNARPLTEEWNGSRWRLTNQ